MNYSHIMGFFLITTFFVTNNCPLCVARLQHDSPAFFSEDFYTITNGSQSLNEEVDAVINENE